jgi:hypothetical protein
VGKAVPAIKIHGHTRLNGKKVLSPTYNSWAAMKRRCNDPTHHHYESYGERGICYQDSWEDFENFLADMGVRLEGTTLDRIDPNGNYCKENCRWATSHVQSLNKRNAVKITVNGCEQFLLDVSSSVGIKYQTLWNRIFTLKWDIQKAITTKPLDRYKRKDSNA